MTDGTVAEKGLYGFTDLTLKKIVWTDDLSLDEYQGDILDVKEAYCHRMKRLSSLNERRNYR